MKGFLHQLFDYNFHGNRTMIQQFGAMGQLPPNCQKLFSHILNSHHIWNQRMLGEAELHGIWEIHPLEKWEELHYGNQRASFELITNTDNFQKRVEYTNSQGKTFYNDIQDILFHIINHSTHHRGQLMMELRASGTPPQPLDYIFYKR